MPLYEFHCEECDRNFELLVSSSRQRDTACPHCGSNRLTKQFSTFATSVASSGSSSLPEACPMKSAGGCGCCGPTHRR
jgi:putative FmdB family regulatory protein